ncbi:MAG: twin-arginine translocase subunit TatC [Kiritimatiellae bacterium]|nr:twin-arginine translocase subunit TatC [Kiritimatiellia bacterium]
MIWPGSKGDVEKPFLEHLEDLRRTLIGTLITLAFALAFAVPLAPRIFRWVRAPLDRIPLHPELRVLEVGGGFSVAMQTILWSTLLFSSPFILFFVAQFVFPGLTARERRTVLGAGGFAVALFVFGASLGYYVTLPVALTVMYKINAWMGLQVEWWTVQSYVAFALRLLLAFGLAFEMPVLILALGHLGVVSSRQLRSKRRIVIVLLLVVAMLLTPPDVATQLLMGMPLIALYELCIWLLWAKEKRRG